MREIATPGKNEDISTYKERPPTYWAVLCSLQPRFHRHIAQLANTHSCFRFEPLDEPRRWWYSKRNSNPRFL